MAFIGLLESETLRYGFVIHWTDVSTLNILDESIKAIHVVREVLEGIS